MIIHHFRLPIVFILLAVAPAGSHAVPIAEEYMQLSAKKAQHNAQPISPEISKFKSYLEAESTHKNIRITGALFDCAPYCEFLHFVEVGDEFIFLKKDSVQENLRFVPAQSIEFKTLFGIDPLVPAQNSAEIPGNSSGADPDQRSEGSAFWSMNFKYALGLELGYSFHQTNNNSAFNIDAQTKPYMNYGLSLDLVDSRTDGYVNHLFRFKMHSEPFRQSSNNVDNAVKWGSQSIEYSKTFFPKFLNGALAPSLVLEQRNRTFKLTSFQGISTAFQDLSVGVYFHQSPRQIFSAHYSIYSRLSDVNAFRTEMQKYQFYRLGYRYCPEESHYPSVKMTICTELEYSSQSEKTGLNSAYANGQDTGTAENKQFKLGLLIFYGNRYGK